MSFVTAILGLDPLLADVRAKYWYGVLMELKTLVHRYADAKTASNLDDLINAAVAAGIARIPLPPATSVLAQ
jgi:hypothetical protein